MGNVYIPNLIHFSCRRFLHTTSLGSVIVHGIWNFIVWSSVRMKFIVTIFYENPLTSLTASHLQNSYEFSVTQVTFDVLGYTNQR